MIDSRRFARLLRSTIAAVALASLPGATSAQADTTSGWRAPGSSSATRAVAPQRSEDNWRLPNGSSTSASTSAHNPLRSTSAGSASNAPSGSKNKVREPRAFQAPTSATRLAAQPAGANDAQAAQPTRPVQQMSPSSAVAQTAAATSSRAPATRAAAHGATSPRIARARTPSDPQIEARMTPMWQRLNVAMQGPDALTSEPEDLPIPEQEGAVIHGDPFGAVPNGYYLEGDAPYYPSCGPDGCGDACCCGDGCGGGVCEPGCACGCGAACGNYGCDGECCNDCLCIGPGDPESCHSIRIRVPKWQELSVFGGVQGFKGPYDQERDSGNFGFHEGFNSGFKIPYTFAGYQIGYQATQSQLNGDKDTDIEESHTQHFITFGLFRRATDGLQFGTAWDVLRDQRFEAVDFHQLRSEISWMDCGRHEWGFNATVGLNEYEDPQDDDTLWQASDQYLLFYRYHGAKGGEGRFYGGWNDASDGIIGSDLLIPVHDRWSIQTGFTYMIPDARNGADGASEEAWNINLALVWHWDYRARKSHNNPYRPLFNVANNGYLIVDNRDND